MPLRIHDDDDPSPLRVVRPPDPDDPPTTLPLAACRAVAKFLRMLGGRSSVSPDDTPIILPLPMTTGDYGDAAGPETVSDPASTPEVPRS